MEPVVQEVESYLLNFGRFEEARAGQEPSWVHQLRNAALSRFAALGFPTMRQEEWKYTNVAPLTKVRFQPVPAQRDGLTAERLVQVARGEVVRAQLVFMNGHYAQELSFLGSLPAGVKARSLAEVLRTNPAAIEPHLARYASYQDHSFVALNTAFMEDGAFVYIPPGTVVEEPIHLLFLSTVRGEPTVSHPRNLIVVGADSQATIIESYVGLEDEVYFTNVVSEVCAGENTVVAHYKLERESEEAFHIATLQAYLDRSCVFSSHSIALGGALARNDLHVVLAGEDSECTLNGLYLVTGRQHVDNHTRIDHVKPHCRSRELYKGVLDGKARGVFSGKIYVHKAAQKTDAKQTNKNLLLSEDAVINTKPQLEIYTDDVKCTHGATIGQLDQDALFYLRSRGIGLEAARSLLTSAFVSEIISQITIGPVRAQLDALVMAKLHRGAQAKGTL